MVDTFIDETHKSWKEAVEFSSERINTILSLSHKCFLAVVGFMFACMLGLISIAPDIVRGVIAAGITNNDWFAVSFFFAILGIVIEIFLLLLIIWIPQMGGEIEYYHEKLFKMLHERKITYIK